MEVNMHRLDVQADDAYYTCDEVDVNEATSAPINTNNASSAPSRNSVLFESLKPKDVNPYGDTMVCFDIELNDSAGQSDTQEVQMLELLEKRYSKEPDTEDAEEYVTMHNYWKFLESKMMSKYPSSNKRDRLEDLSGRYVGHDLASIETDDTEDRDFIDNSHMNDLCVPGNMHLPHKGFYVNDERLIYEMDEDEDQMRESEEGEGEAMTSQDETMESVDKKRKRKRKDIGEIVIAKRQNLAVAHTGAEGGGGGDVGLFADWTEHEFKLLRRSVRKFKSDWHLIQQTTFPAKAPEVLRKAWTYFRKKKRLQQQNAVDSEGLSTVTISTDGQMTDGTLSQSETVCTEEDSAHSELLNCAESCEDTLSLASLIRSQTSSLSLTGSIQLASKLKMTPNTTCHVVCDEENLPLSRIKENRVTTDTNSDFDSYLSSLPGITQRIIKMLLTQYNKCEGDVEREKQVFTRYIPRLIPHMSASRFNKKYKCSMEEQIVTQFKSDQSRDLFKVKLTSTRGTLMSQFRELMNKLRATVENEKKLQQKNYDRKVKILMEKRPKFAESVATEDNPTMPQKKFTYSKQFKDVFKELVVHYLKIYYVEALSGNRDRVLRRYFARKLLPLWSSSPSSATPNSEVSVGAECCIAEAEEKIRGNKWGVTADSLLQVFRLLMSSSEKPKLAKPDSVDHTKTKIKEDFNAKAASKVKVDLNRESSTGSTVPQTPIATTNVIRSTSSVHIQKNQASVSSVNKAKSEVSPGSNRGENLDSSNEDLDVTLASLISSKNSQARQSTTATKPADVAVNVPTSKLKGLPVPSVHQVHPAHSQRDLENVSSRTYEEIVKQVSFGVKSPPSASVAHMSFPQHVSPTAADADLSESRSVNKKGRPSGPKTSPPNAQVSRNKSPFAADMSQTSPAAEYMAQTPVSYQTAINSFSSADIGPLLLQLKELENDQRANRATESAMSCQRMVQTSGRNLPSPGNQGQQTANRALPSTGHVQVNQQQRYQKSQPQDGRSLFSGSSSLPGFENFVSPSTTVNAKSPAQSSQSISALVNCSSGNYAQSAQKLNLTPFLNPAQPSGRQAAPHGYHQQQHQNVQFNSPQSMFNSQPASNVFSGPFVSPQSLTNQQETMTNFLHQNQQFVFNQQSQFLPFAAGDYEQVHHAMQARRPNFSFNSPEK